MFKLLASYQRLVRASFVPVALAVSFAGCASHANLSGAMPTTVLPAERGLERAADASGAFVRNAPREPQAKTTPIPLNVPIGLAMDRHDNLYVANGGGSQVLVYNSSNKQLTSKTITDGMNKPADLAFDRKGNLYVSQFTTREVTVYDPARKRIPGKTLHTIKANNFAPSGVAIDAKGNVWVASRDNYSYNIGEVQVFDSSGKVIEVMKKQLEYPDGIVFVKSEAWVCDSTTPGGNAITIFDSSGNYVKKIATPSFTPTYAGLDSQKDVYVGDGLATQIEVFNGSGKLLHTLNSKGLDLPYGIVFNHAGDYYVANAGNNTITEYNPHGRLIHVIR